MSSETCPGCGAEFTRKQNHILTGELVKYYKCGTQTEYGKMYLSDRCKIAQLTRERDELRAELAAAKSRTLPAIWRQQQPTPTSCFRACVATILKIPVDEVTRACDGDSWDWDAFQDWLQPRGLQAVEVIMDRDGPVLYPIPHGVPVIITGKSPRPCPSGQHAVVAKSIGLDGFDLVHDPHEANEFIEGDAKFATFFAVIKPDGITAASVWSIDSITAQLTAERAAHEATKAKLAEVEREQWKCFHCGSVFADADKAKEHFGASEEYQPACQIDIKEYRRMEESERRHCEEDTELHREINRLHSDISTKVRRAEEDGYAKGLRDYTKIENQLATAQAAQLAAETNAESALKSLRECQAQAAAMRKGLDAVAALIGESRGVAGYHYNGDEAEWEELRTGGRFEEVLLDFDKALATDAGRELLAEVERLRGSETS